MTSLEQAAYLMWLKDECGYRDPRPLDDKRYTAIMPLLFTTAIITGRFSNPESYDDRWCYHDYASAKAAYDAWDGNGEPQGWHRHPDTGRRRTPEGEEYINL